VTGTYKYRDTKLKAQIAMIRQARTVMPAFELSDPEITAITTALLNYDITSFEQTRRLDDRTLLLVRNIGPGRLGRIRMIESRLIKNNGQQTLDLR
jgi:hypothetical protein